jgi:hypothetical protein
MVEKVQLPGRSFQRLGQSVAWFLVQTSGFQVFRIPALEVPALGIFAVTAMALADIHAHMRRLDLAITNDRAASS